MIGTSRRGPGSPRTTDTRASPSRVIEVEVGVRVVEDQSVSNQWHFLKAPALTFKKVVKSTGTYLFKKVEKQILAVSGFNTGGGQVRSGQVSQPDDAVKQPAHLHRPLPTSGGKCTDIYLNKW